MAVPVAPSLPISLFWLGWTSYRSISPWSSLSAIVLFGISWAGIYVTVYQYILDVYGVYAGSALAAITFLRYMVSGIINIVSRPMYHNLGVHWTMTVLGTTAILLAPVPFLFMWKGPSFRQRGKVASLYNR
jgi:DHA1 family multidrug resistance protein-like MFS transporter